MGASPTRQSPASSRNRVLRGPSQARLRSVHRKHEGRVFSPVIALFNDALPVASKGGRTGWPSRRGQSGRLGVVAHGIRARVPPGTCEIQPFPRQQTEAGGSLTAILQARDVRCPTHGSEGGAPTRYRRTRATEWQTVTGRRTRTGGKDGRKSERLVLPAKRGNPPQGTPRREGGAGT